MDCQKIGNIIFKKISYVKDNSKNEQVGECYLNINNIHITDNSYNFNFTIPTLIVPIGEYERLVNDYIGHYDKGFQSADETTYKEFLNTLHLGVSTNKFKEHVIKIKEIINK